MTLIVGLSGGIGSGKSTVANFFRELGAVVIDADVIVHELQAAGEPLLKELSTAFGAEILKPDGSLDRPALAARVFGDASERARLNAIVHPAFAVECDRRIAEAVAADAAMVVVDIPLLFEGIRSGAGYAARQHFDATVLVWVSEPLQVERTMARDDCTEEQARQRIDAQMPLSDKRELANYVIENEGTLADTETQVRTLFEKLSAMEAQNPA